ncbi:adenylosuccinate synthetase, partial [Candidatus Woesearchaeota archaeon]|nr:adenylosuccinate synthetase [Candidatus Woesearchaeota archaeon]
MFSLSTVVKTSSFVSAIESIPLTITAYFPTEITGAVGEKIQKIGKEFGATTGRQRRVGWFDALVGRYAVMINGIDSIALTKLDVFTTIDKIKICVAYKHKGSIIKNF